MTSPAITSVFNDAYIAEVYESYRRDPGSVDESWRQYFRTAEALAGLLTGAPAPAQAGDPDLARKAAGAAGLVEGLREYGHLAVQLDPLGTPPIGASELTPEFYGITEADLDDVSAAALGFDDRFRTAGDVVRLLRKRYSAALGLEYSHVSSDEERDWFRQVLREEQLTRPLTPEESRALLVRLTEVDGLERYLGFRYQGKKRFSIEGTDALVPMLDTAIAETAADGARSVVIGMAHRGRLNVLTHVMGKAYEVLFGEFEGRHPNADSDSETGDVKYHMGYRGRRTVNGVDVELELVPNPSHLEFTGCVADGVARAKQRVPNAPDKRDEACVLPIVIHGDAAFMGEGVVAESLNMSMLRGYSVGGTLHIITNNQVGFTTDPQDSRSTYYASDLAKGFDIPVIHVNGDDAAACIAAARIAVAYRARFKKDFLIDLVGYRRWGHNETDEPAFTQPVLYDRIRAHATPRQVWGERLVREGVLSAPDVEAIDKEVRAKFDAAYERVRQTPESQAAAEGTDSPEGQPAPPPERVDTSVPAERLTELNAALLHRPAGFNPHPRLAKILGRRLETLGEKGGIDWGQAESLAFASLLVEGTSIRLDGQDAERGTFGHRNAVVHDVKTGKTYTPLAALPNAKGAFEVYNSPLTETAVMGFDYGYSVAAPDTLALWEAQYGDFVNVAQVIIDQYLVADRAKWSTDSGLVLLLPHGYEGGGPEHSSARLERFLQACAEGNVEVAYPSTPAQYFHILRRQAKRGTRRPLVLMQPKSLLRLPAAASRLTDLAEGSFQPVVDDPRGLAKENVGRVVLCTAKMYYDLTAQSVPNEVAVVRVEELYPWPAEELAALFGAYASAREVVWAQEEPQNMGAWTFAAPRLRAIAGERAVTYVGRPERASPAEGFEAAHKAEQARIVAEALAVHEPSRERATV